MQMSTFEVSFNEAGMAAITFDRPRRLALAEPEAPEILLARGHNLMRLNNAGEVVDFPPLSPEEYTGLLTARKVIVIEADADGIEAEPLAYVVKVTEVILGSPSAD